MKVLVISDTHFNHANIIEYSNRPFSSVDEMNETIVKNWNGFVTNSDWVFHLGDVALGRFDVSQLNGFKILVKGNHDSRYIREQFDISLPAIWETPRILLSHKPQTPKSGQVNLHGHIHDGFTNHPRCFNFSVEVLNYYPAIMNMDYSEALVEGIKQGGYIK